MRLLKIIFENKKDSMNSDVALSCQTGSTTYDK